MVLLDTPNRAAALSLFTDVLASVGERLLPQRSRHSFELHGCQARIVVRRDAPRAWHADVCVILPAPDARGRQVRRVPMDNMHFFSKATALQVATAEARAFIVQFVDSDCRQPGLDHLAENI